MAKFGFDVDEVEVSERGAFEVIPEGTEVVMKATDAELKKTKSGDGAYIAATFEVVKGEHANRKIWVNFNIQNPSNKAEKIGREQVAGWARACGKPNAKDSDDLLERNFSCVLGIEKGTGGYSDKNNIKSFLMPESAGKSEAKKPAPSEVDTDLETSAPVKEKTATPTPSKKEASTASKKNPWDD